MTSMSSDPSSNVVDMSNPNLGVPMAEAARISPRPLLFSVLFILAGILAGIAALSPWWTLTVSGSLSGSFNFYPGSSYELTTAQGATSMVTYSSAADLGSLSGLYEAVLGLLLAIFVLCLIIGFLLFLFGIRRPALGRFSLSFLSSQRTWFLIVTFALIVLALVAVVLVPLAQPGLIKNCSGSGATECNSFWGSSSNGGINVSWGAAVGWSLGVASAVFLILIPIAYWLTGRGKTVPASVTAATPPTGAA
jgi:hypothetical protein